MTPATSQRTDRAWPVLLSALAVFGALSAWRGADANWDERNYHLYGAYALLSGRLSFDIVPAHNMTLLIPLVDVLRAALRAAVPWPAPQHALLAVPHALAVTVAYRIALLLAPGAAAWRIAAAALATVIGATGAAALPTLGASMSEMPSGAFVLFAVLLLIRAPDAPSRRTLIGAGACLGIAAGLKLTAALICLGVLVACAACVRAPGRLRATAILGGAAAVCLLAVAGPWWALIAWRTGNPVFPQFNNIFHSPLIPPSSLADRRFIPSDAMHAIFYPFYWAASARPIVSELPLRDPRFAFAWIAIVLGAAFVRSRRAAFLSVLFVVTYISWVAEFSILRYLAPLELLTGVAVLAALRRWGVRAACAGLLATAAACAWLTVYPDWGHVLPRGAPVHVEAPAFEPGSLVLLLDDAPMAYVASFAEPRARFMGINNNTARLGQSGDLAHEIEAAIRAQTGPLWGLEEPAESPGMADATLAFYGLVRAGCAPLVSNLDGNAIIACRLRRKDA